MSQTASARDAIAGQRHTGVSKRLLRNVLMLGGIAVLIVGGTWYWLQGGRWVSVDDSYVRAARLAVSTDVSGVVQSVEVREGQRVTKGQVLLRLDPVKFQIAVDGAKADLAQTILAIEAMKHDYERMLRDAASHQAQVQSDKINLDRLGAVVKSGGVTKQEYDNARYKLEGDQQALAALQAQAQAQLAKLSGNPDIAPADTPDVKAAQARVDEAQREFDHSILRAPFDGVVTQVESTQPGMYLAASTAAFALVSSTDIWVEANPKETQLTWVKPGDQVDLYVDTYPGRTWHGVVESISPSSGSEASLIPAQNASGNWVKVVQRIPLRITVDRPAGAPELRSGMSVTVDIDTGHIRRLSDLF